MEEYELFWDNILIGRLTVSADGAHRYLPAPDGVAAAEPRAILLSVMRTGTDGFTAPIPFFANRLRNLRRWSLTEIGYRTDRFLLRRISP